MSLEDDQDRLAQKMKEAMTSAMANQPDILTFCLRGTEIQARLIKAAEGAEAEAVKLNDSATHKNVRPIRSRLPMPPGYPGLEPMSEEAQRDMNAQMAKSYLHAAEDLRFLAAHVEEDRFFRLSIHDLNALGFTLFGPMAIGGQ